MTRLSSGAPVACEVSAFYVLLRERLERARWRRTTAGAHGEDRAVARVHRDARAGAGQCRSAAIPAPAPRRPPAADRGRASASTAAPCLGSLTETGAARRGCRTRRRSTRRVAVVPRRYLSYCYSSPLWPIRVPCAMPLYSFSSRCSGLISDTGRTAAPRARCAGSCAGSARPRRRRGTPRRARACS